MKNSSGMNGVVSHSPQAARDPPNSAASSAEQDQRNTTLRAG